MNAKLILNPISTHSSVERKLNKACVSLDARVGVSNEIMSEIINNRIDQHGIQNNIFIVSRATASRGDSAGTSLLIDVV
jgi:hypothetical protein